MRSGSAATARNGKIDVMPMTWKSACASESEKMAPSFALPYGRARKRTRRIRSATLWINRDKAVPSYTFKNNSISQRRECRIICGKNSGVKDSPTTDDVSLFPHVRSHAYSRAAVPICLLFKGRLRHDAPMKPLPVSCAIILTLLLGALNAVHADSATWNLDPKSGDWNTATNWTPNTVPNDPADVATFEASNQTAISLSANTIVDSIVFNPSASAFTISVIGPPQLTIDGVGVVNNSGVVQKFFCDTQSPQQAGLVAFTGSASARSQCVFTANGSSSVGASIAFSDTASAGTPLLLSPTAAPLALLVTSHF